MGRAETSSRWKSYAIPQMSKLFKTGKEFILKLNKSGLNSILFFWSFCLFFVILLKLTILFPNVMLIILGAAFVVSISIMVYIISQIK